MPALTQRSVTGALRVFPVSATACELTRISGVLLDGAAGVGVGVAVGVEVVVGVVGGVEVVDAAM